jgi:hypothetical protein
MTLCRPTVSVEAHANTDIFLQNQVALLNLVFSSNTYTPPQAQLSVYQNKNANLPFAWG